MFSRKFIRTYLRLILWVWACLGFILIYQSINVLPAAKNANSDTKTSSMVKNASKMAYSRNEYPKLLGEQYFTPYVVRGDRNILIYSAYIDFRKGNMGPTPAIRFMAVADVTKKIDLFCRFPKSDGGIFVEIVSWYETPEPHGLNYAAYVLSCLIPKVYADPINQLTKIELSQKAGNYAITIPISNYVADKSISTISKSKSKSKDVFRRRHTVCVPTLFGDRYTNRHLIEFVEANIVLGIDYFFFYVLDRDFRRYKKVLEYYRNKNRLTYFNLTLPIDETSIWNYAQSLVIQDCLFRNVHFSRYVIFNDIDEYAVPYAADTWPVLSKRFLWKEPDRAGYSLPTFYFRVENADGRDIDLAKVPVPVTLKLNRGAKIGENRFTKCIIRPERVFDQGIHHVSRVIQHHYSVTLIDSKTAALHHFKNQIFGEVIENNRLKDLLKKGNRFEKAYSKVVRFLKV